MNSAESLDPLDLKANEAFAGKVVRKDLVRRVKVGANVPVYVLEYLLGKYCASDDPEAVEVGLRVVNETLAEHFIRPDEAQRAQAMLKRAGQARLIDKVKVRPSWSAWCRWSSGTTTSSSWGRAARASRSCTGSCRPTPSSCRAAGPRCRRCS
jgi:hypothetical protein